MTPSQVTQLEVPLTVRFSWTCCSLSVYHHLSVEYESEQKDSPGSAWYVLKFCVNCLSPECHCGKEGNYGITTWHCTSILKGERHKLRNCTAGIYNVRNGGYEGMVGDNQVLEQPCVFLADRKDGKSYLWVSNSSPVIELSPWCPWFTDLLNHSVSGLWISHFISRKLHLEKTMNSLNL